MSAMIGGARRHACGREAAQRPGHEVGIIGEGWAGHQVRLRPRPAQVVVEAARPGIGPVEDRPDARQPLGFIGKLPQLGEARLEPGPVVEREVAAVEGGAAHLLLPLVELDAQLHVRRALEERLGQLEEPRAPCK